MTMIPQDFVSKWKRVSAREKQTVQEHFLDLCALVGHPTPIEMDPSGSRFAFEMGATKTGGGQGWADVAKVGYFGWEYKGIESHDSNLTKAYDQLLRYRDALQNPPLLIVSDINSIIIRTNYTNLPTRTITLSLDDLLTADALKTLHAVFFNPDELKPRETVQTVTEAAAREFSKLAAILRKYAEDNQRVAHFLIRLLFCLFAEDVGLLPERLLPHLIEQTRHRSKDFMDVLRQLFHAMNHGGFFGADRILFFNGGLFDDDNVLELDGDGMDILASIDSLDWAAIEPSIFGTLFERGLDPTKRSQLGAHYTSKDDILLIVEPVLMAPLRREWNEIKESAQKIADSRDALSLAGLNEASRQKVIRQRKKLTDQIRKMLQDFASKIAGVTVLDPACGSGNFLYVALRLLLDLQNEIANLSDQLGAGRFFIPVRPSQLHGIEINEYAHELAQITIWIGYIQWLRDNGYGLPSEPILEPIQNILQMNAILAYDADGKPVEPAWPAAEVIIGNPPFLGDKKMREELGAEYVNQLRSLYADRLPGGVDFVTYWFEKARECIEKGKSNRAGLLATNSIRTGSNRKVLDRIKSSGNIFMAWSDRSWILDGAAVRVSMVGFDNGTERERFLDGKQQLQINADLSSHTDVTTAKHLSENDSLCFLGMMKAGPFDIDSATANKMLAVAHNPNGKPNSDVIKRRLGGQDVVKYPRDAWIIDFNDMPLDQACLYEMPFEYVRKNVKPLRDVNRDNFLRNNWWLHGRSRPELRNALKGKDRCIVTPEVAKHRIFKWMNTNVIPDHKIHVIARDDDYFFGVLQSRLHEVWTLAMCSWMGVGNDPSYSSSRTFETFPFPWPPGKELQDDPCVQAIAAAAKELVEMRDRWLNPEGCPPEELKKRTLTNLYNQRPTWLDLAHKKLDAAVFAAYSWPPDLTDEQILEKLLALNSQRAEANP